MKAGWQTKPFESCVEDIVYSIKVQRTKFLDVGAYPIVSQEEGMINGYWNNEADLFRVRRPVVVFGDHTKVLKYIDFDFVLGADGVKILQPKNFLVPRFFYYQLQIAKLDSLGYARHYKLLKKLEISFPDPTEQHRIVATLDEAFAGIATATANAERNLNNSRELFESYLQSIFSDKDQKWKMVKLSDLCTDITDGDHQPPPKAVNGIPFITISNIEKSAKRIDFTNTFKVPKGYYEKIKTNRKPCRGDILYTVTGSFGIPIIVDFDTQFCFQRHIGLIRPSSQVDPKLLFYVMLSPGTFKQADDCATGAAQRTVSLQSLRNFNVPRIPLAEQGRIVALLDELSIETQRLQAIYQQKHSVLNELKQSVLHQAFSGQLH